MRVCVGCGGVPVVCCVVREAMWSCMLSMIGVGVVVIGVMSVVVCGVCCWSVATSGFNGFLHMENDPDGIVTIVFCSALFPVLLFVASVVMIVTGVDRGKAVASCMNSRRFVWSRGSD